MSHVRYNLESFNRCLCGGCPVNRQSACTHEHEKALEAVFGAIEKGGPLPEPRAMPGIYCSVGASVCEDMDAGRPCLCPGCSIHLRQALGNTHYCTSGSAEEVG